MNLMKKVVANVAVVLMATLYLLVKSLYNTVREFREEIRPIIGEVSLIRSILYFCLGVCAIGYAGVFAALVK